MGSMGDLVGRRLDHPLIGPVFVSWCVWNWPAVVWFLGAVAEPALAHGGIAAHLREESIWRLAVFPVASGMLYAFGAPYLHLIYLKFDDFLRDRRVYQEGVMKNEAPIYASEYRQALSKTEKLAAHCDSVISSFQPFREAMHSYQTAVTIQIESLGVGEAPNVINAKRNKEVAEGQLVDAVRKLTDFRQNNMQPGDWYTAPMMNGWKRLRVLTFGGTRPD